MFDELLKLSQHFLAIKNQPFKRYFIQTHKLNHPLSFIIGQRGIGKTTTVIQYLLSEANHDRFSSEILYIQADHFLMGKTTLYEVAEAFFNLGGKVIAFDEIHKYPNWSLELKSIYDTFPSLKIIASGSSALEVHKGTHDLSRRAVVYRMHGLSFREYLELYYDLKLPTFSLENILSNHEKIVSDILPTISQTNKKILSHFSDYLSTGYYPYYREINDVSTFYLIVEQNIHTIIESDLVAIYPSLTGNSIKKIKHLLVFISQSVPFTTHWQKLKSIMQIGDDRTLKTYLKYLEDAELIQTITNASAKLQKLETPEKIYLNNSNQMHALSWDHQNKGTIRETFFLNILSTKHTVKFPIQGDFLVDSKSSFEVGGKNKTFSQIKPGSNAYLVCDEIENGIGAKIPLWLFGFLY